MAKRGRKAPFTPPEITRDEVRKRCESSIFWTAWYLCGFKKLSLVLHWALCVWYESRRKAGKRRFLIMVPRGHFKTSLITIAGTVHDLIRDPNKRILIVFHNQKEAIRKGRKIKSIFRSDAMKFYYPELYPTPNAEIVWQSEEFSIPRTSESPESSVTLAGVSTGVVGGHYDKIIIDDGVDNKASNSQAAMEAAVNYLRGVDPLFEDESSELLIVGTLWPGGPDGFYEQTMDNEHFEKVIIGCYVDERFKALLHDTKVKLPEQKYISSRVLEDNRADPWGDGTPIFPERRTERGLAEERSTMGPYVFAHQMLNIVRDENERSFRREDFREYSMTYDHEGKARTCSVGDAQYPLSRMRITLAIDPTGGVDRSGDTAAITVCAWFEPHAIGFLLDYWQKKSPSPKEQIEKLIEMAEKWDVDIVIPEHVAMQVWVQAWLKQELVRRRRHFRIEPYKPGHMRKGIRLLDRFHPFVEDHMFYVLPEHGAFVNHMVSLNITPDGQVIGESPALADTMPMHAAWWTRGYGENPDKERIKTEEDEVILDMTPRYNFTCSKYTGGSLL